MSVKRVAEGTTCDDHEDGPDTYVAWQDWAKQMAKTHRQVRCPACGLFKIWVPKADSGELDQ